MSRGIFGRFERGKTKKAPKRKNPPAAIVEGPSGTPFS
jgi:hypothetical protein